mgnify:CR=1 FL=1
MASRGLKSTAPDDLFRTATATLGGVEYTFRELSVKDNDSCVLASRQPDGSFDGRIMMRFMVLKSSLEPKITDTELMSLPQRIYLRMCDIVSDLNADDEIDETDDAEAKND